MTDDRSHTPRLSILHLMLWTLCSGVYLTLVRAIYRIQELPEDLAALEQTSSVIRGMVTGAALAGAITLGYARYRGGPPLARHPGHWLLLVTAALTVIYFPLLLLLSLLAINASFSSAFFLFYAAVYLAQAIAYSFATGHTTLVRWKAVFGALVLLGVLQGIGYATMWADSPGLWFWWLTVIPLWGHFLVAGWVVVLSISDLVAGTWRDWLHWTGIATHIADYGVFLFWMVGAWLLQ